jgi:general secretion pathway protein H
MTLIELIVALAIMMAVFSAAILGVGALTGTRARGMAGELAGTIRSLYDTASLTGKVCRLVFELPAAENASGFSYRAECGPGTLTARMDRELALREDTQLKDLADKRRAQGLSTSATKTHSTFQDVMNQEKDRVENEMKFSSFTSEMVKPKKVSGVSLSLWTRHQRDPVRTGLAYLYFFPQGYTERAQVYLRQGNNVWTLLVAPLTGKTTVVGEERPVPRS